MTKTFTIAAIAASIAATGLAAPAFAGETGETRTTAVRYSDLDLDTAAGQRKLERRLELAARDVCGVDEVVTGSRLASSSSRACYTETLENLSREVAMRIDRAAQRG
jgi:UrcA family protein